MTIQLIVHSQTGNTLSVANALKASVEPINHTVTLTHVEANNEREMDLSKIAISAIPDCSEADMIVLGGPVRGASASPAILKTISSLGSVKGKKCVVFTTEFFPYDWMGGKRAVTMMEKELTARGAQVMSHAIIHWKRRDRENQINQFISNFKSLL
jgi:flavodoxin